MLKILFKFIYDNEKEFRFIWNLNITVEKNIENLLELSNSLSFKFFLKKFNSISFIFKEKEYEDIGNFFEYIVYGKISYDLGKSISEIIRISNLYNVSINKIIKEIKHSCTAIFLEDTHISMLRRMKLYYSNSYQCTNINNLLKFYEDDCINLIDLTKIIENEGIQIYHHSGNFYIYFIPTNKAFSVKPDEFEKQYKKYYNFDKLVFYPKKWRYE